VDPLENREFKLHTPVAFFIFNRPNVTRRVFDRIRNAKPSTLLVIADGPRGIHQEDQEKCRQVTEIVDTGVDWPCTVLKNYSETNLGCRKRVSSGLDWVFENVESAIILEDDCLPDPTFFPFCEELLLRYQDDERIMMISGDNFQFGKTRTKDSYYFSRYAHIWGWASWRRAWRHYDAHMQNWPYIRDSELLRSILPESKALARWKKIFRLTFAGVFDTWDYQWVFACWINNGLSILPQHNLVSNIGFGTEGTHTSEKNQLAAINTRPIDFPLQHPITVMRNYEADVFTENLVTNQSSLIAKVQRKLKSCQTLIRSRMNHSAGY
jgi:hypothetical protein